MFGAMWGKLGGPEADSTWLRTYEDGEWTLQTKKSKDFGFAFGFGSGSGWPAARTSAAEPQVPRLVTVSFDERGVRYASQFRVTVLEPDGSSVQTACISSPCSVEADGQQGSPLMKLDYLSAAGQVLASGDWMPVALK